MWDTLNRPNVFIKVPATAEGLPAIRQLISEGINVNVTLLFGLPRYRQVAEAYIAGIEARAAQGKPVKHIASVASFFVSRIDALVDPLLEKLIAQGGEKAEIAKKVHGQVAIASAKVAYQIYKEIFGSDRFRKLAAQGARVQRLLWASTGTKNPDYSDVKYIEASHRTGHDQHGPARNPRCLPRSRRAESHGSNKMSRKPAGCWRDCRNWASASTR